MPYSPFARFLAVVIVLLCGVGLLWPDDRAYQWIYYGMAAAPILLGLFTWSAVRSAPPFDDRAFHRGLPPGDGHAFFRVVWLHLLVLAGIALAVVVYCWIANFGWRAMSWGIVMFTLPAWAFCAAVGLAASAGSSNQHWRSVSWIAVFATPVFSGLLLYWARQGLVPEDKTESYFTPVRTVALAAAGLYPLSWWLVAVARRRGMGLIFGAATSALVPWLYVYGDFMKVPEKEARVFGVNPVTVTVARKPLPADIPRWMPASEVLEVKGLEEGKQAEVYLSIGKPGAVDRTHLRMAELLPESTPEIGRAQLSPPVVSMVEGRLVWGNKLVYDAMRAQLPAHESFEPWSRKQAVGASPLVLLTPSRPHPLPPEGSREEAAPNYRMLGLERFVEGTWEAWVTSSMPWRLLGSCPVAEGGSIRLASGGRLKVLPLELMDGGGYELRIREYEEDLWQAQGPWFEKKARGYRQMRLLFADETGKHVYAADFLGGEDGKVMLGEFRGHKFRTGVPDNPDLIRKIEMLKKARVYIFSSENNLSGGIQFLPPAR